MNTPVSFDKQTAQRLVTMLRSWEGTAKNAMHRRRGGGGSRGRNYPFKIKKTGVNEVTVIFAYWTRNGFRTYDDAVPIVFTGLALNTTYYIVAELIATGAENPEVYPDDLTISAETSWSPPSDIFDTRKLIGIVTMGVALMEPIDQRWTGGDIDDTVALPDSEAASPSQHSLQLRTASGHKGESQLYNFDSNTGVDSSGVSWGASDTEYMLLAKHRDGTIKTLKYVYPTTLAVVTNVSYTPATGVLAQTKRTVTILDYSTTTTTTVEQADGCTA